MNRKHLGPLIMLGVSGLVGCEATGVGTSQPPPPVARAAAVPSSTINVIPREFREEVRVDGEFLSAGLGTEVFAERSGRVVALSVEVGDAVHEGQVLAHLDPAEAQAQVEEARAELSRVATLAENSARRVREYRVLSAKDHVSRSELDQVIADEAVARAQVDGARARLSATQTQVRRTTIYAPFSGRVAEKMVSAGDYLREGDALLRVTHDRALELALNVPERYFGVVDIGALIELDGATVPVSRVQPSISSVSRTFRVYAYRPAGWRVAAGQPVSASLVIREQQLLAVPEAAVVLEGVQSYAYVISEGKAAKVAVTREAQSDGWVGVVGLSEGVRVAVSGAGFLRDGAAVVVTEAEIAVSRGRKTP